MTGLPLFRGDGSEDADQWLREIAFATSNCNDSGAFRILSSHLQGDSPAREWYDQLDDSFKSSWSPFERVFRSLWIISTPVPNPTDVAWEKFCKHRLSYEALLNTPSSPPTDATPPSDICPTISTWAEEHLILGKATDREDQSLIDMSKALLPPFIQAHIEVSHQPQPSNFEEFCAAIGQIPSAVADLERVRRRLSSEDWQVRIEQRIQDIAEKVDKLLRCGMQVINSFAAEISAESNQTEPLPNDSAESIAWEPSSPLTSVVSQPNDAVSEPSTPLARTGNLPDAIELALSPHLDTDIPDSLRIPDDWRKPTVFQQGARSRQQRKWNVHDRTIDGLIIEPCQYESLTGALSLYDRLSGSTLYEEKAIEILSSDRHVQYWIKISNRHLDDYIETKLGWRGLAMVYGYRAYKHPYLMAGALSYWSRTQPRIIARFYRVSGWIVHETSSGVAAFAGFVRQDGSGGHLDCHETLLLMTLSSHLAECTKNDEYKEHALLAADRIKSMLLDPNTMLIKDGTQSSVSVSSTRVDGDYSGLSSCFTGLFIEALSLLASVTDDESWMTLAIQIATAAMKTSEWHGSDGILDVGSDGNVASNEDCRAFKGVLLRGLLEAYRRSNNVPFRNLVRSYINVQFNALRELASDGEYYGMDWKGPYKGPFLHAQLAALDTMVAAIGVNDS